MRVAFGRGSGSAIRASKKSDGAREGKGGGRLSAGDRASSASHQAHWFGQTRRPLTTTHEDHTQTHPRPTQQADSQPGDDIRSIIPGQTRRKKEEYLIKRAVRQPGRWNERRMSASLSQRDALESQSTASPTSAAPRLGVQVSKIASRPCNTRKINILSARCSCLAKLDAAMRSNPQRSVDLPNSQIRSISL